MEDKENRAGVRRVTARPETGSERRAQARRPETGSERRAQASRPETGSERRAQASRPETGSERKAQARRPETGSARKAQASRPEMGSARRAQVGKPETGSARRAQASRPQAGNAARRTEHRPQTSRAAAGRPGSVSVHEKRRTTTGRPLDEDRRARKKPAERRKRPDVRSAHKHRKNRNENVIFLAAAVVIGLVLAFIVSGIMRAGMLRTKQIETEYDLNDTFDVNNYIEADSDDATVTLKDELDISELGEYKFKYRVTRGRMSKTKTASINVTDSVSPYIDGSSVINVAVGDTIDWSKYYTVTDADPDIQSKLTASADVTTDEEKSVSVILSAKDWAGNETLISVTVNVVNNSENDVTE